MRGFELYSNYHSEDEMLSNCDGAIFPAHNGVHFMKQLQETFLNKILPRPATVTHKTLMIIIKRTLKQ